MVSFDSTFEEKYHREITFKFPLLLPVVLLHPIAKGVILALYSDKLLIKISVHILKTVPFFRCIRLFTYTIIICLYFVDIFKLL